MIIDSQEYFSTLQAPTATGDTPSTNVYDTGSVSDDGVGPSPLIAITNPVAALSATGTIQFVLQTSVDNATWTDAAASPVYTQTTLAAALVKNGGFAWVQNLPVGLNRYIRVAYRIGTAVFTAGQFNAFLTLNEQLNKPYPSGFAVL